MTEYLACDKEYSTEVVFNSITTEFALYCKQGHLKEFVQSITLLASSVISTVLMMLQDKLGSRKVMILTFLFMGVPGFLLIVFMDGLVFKVAGIVGLWVYGDVTLVLTSVFFNEQLVAPYRNISNVSGQIVSMIGALFGTMMTFYLTDYRQVIWLFFSGYIAFTIALFWIFPNSPSYLLKQMKTEELTEAITTIGKINCVTEEKLQATKIQLNKVIMSNSESNP